VVCRYIGICRDGHSDRPSHQAALWVRPGSAGLVGVTMGCLADARSWIQAKSDTERLLYFMVDLVGGALAAIGADG
jgi:hypothetical protein